MGGTLATVGMFDGLHSGHRFLLDFICREAKAEGLSTTVVTFANHPLSVVRPHDTPRLLSSPDEKKQLLTGAGIDNVVMLKFTPELRNMTAHQFIEMLRDNYGITHLAMGFNNSFGNDRSLTFDDFHRIGQEAGVKIIAMPEYRDHGHRVSSSVVRRLVSAGDINSVTTMLGRRYSLTGEVVHGRRVGHTIGFPTANINPSFPLKIIPANGVYTAITNIDGKTYRAMVNIGMRPTFESETPSMSIEAHIDGLDRELYGSTITLEFTSRLRNEMKFNSVDELKSQLSVDLKALRAIPF